MKLKEVLKVIEKKYPLDLAYSWDNVGLLVGNYESDIKKIMLTLEANEEVINEAINKNVDLIITHHPFIFNKLEKINTRDLKGKLIHKLIKNDISIYSMHTNFDIAFEGLNDYFMELIGVTDTKILEVTKSEVLYSLCVYVPVDYCEKVKDAIMKTGAGIIGNYSHCSFNMNGVATFKPLEGSNPFIGSKDSVEAVNEIKVETVVPERLLNKVITEMIKAHPYEEVGYDLYRLENKGHHFGLGRIGKLEKEINLETLCNTIKEKLDMNNIRVVGSLDSKVRKIAVVTGSGSDLIKKAYQKGVDTFITGDVKYHDAQDALDLGINVIDCGHFETEKIFSDIMNKFLEDSLSIDIIRSEVNLNPFKVF